MVEEGKIQPQTEVIWNLAVNVMLGTNYVDRCIKEMFSTKRDEWFLLFTESSKIIHPQIGNSFANMMCGVVPKEQIEQKMFLERQRELQYFAKQYH